MSEWVIVCRESVKSKISPYFKDQYVPIILYAYATPIVTQIFNYKHVLQDLNIDNFMCKFPIHI